MRKGKCLTSKASGICLYLNSLCNSTKKKEDDDDAEDL